MEEKYKRKSVDKITLRAAKVWDSCSFYQSTRQKLISWILFNLIFKLLYPSSMITPVNTEYINEILITVLNVVQYYTDYISIMILI